MFLIYLYNYHFITNESNELMTNNNAHHHQYYNNNIFNIHKYLSLNNVNKQIQGGYWLLYNFDIFKCVYFVPTAYIIYL